MRRSGPVGGTAQVPLRVEVWSDSLAVQAEAYLNFYLGLGGKAKTVVHGWGGTAICDWLPDMRKELDASNPAAFHPQAAVLEFTGDNWTPCMHNEFGVALLGQDLVRKYAADAVRVVQLFQAAKVPVYFVGTPIDRTEVGTFVYLTQLGRIFAQLPRQYPQGGLVRWIDAATPLEWHGRFTYTLPCQKWETCTGSWPDGTRTVTVRQSDGIHFCPVQEYRDPAGGYHCPAPMPGAARFALAISGPILRDFRRS